MPDRALRLRSRAAVRSFRAGSVVRDGPSALPTCRRANRAQEIEADPALLEFVRPCTREGTQRGLARVVDAPPRASDDADDRALDDDRTAFVEVRKRLLHGEEGTAHVDVEYPVEV